MQLVATLLLLLVVSLGPGLLIVRRFHWRPLETLVGAVAASLLVQYLAAFALYASGGDSSLAYVLSGLAGIALWHCRRDLARLWSHGATRRAMLAQLALIGWILLLLMLVRTYSGGRWCCDWLEHYERARFFTDHEPLGTRFLGTLYALPARPPMMNLIAAQTMLQAGTGYDVFQVVFAWLNALAFLPCCMLARELAPRLQRRFWMLAAVFALNPMFVQNSLYAWTKLFAAFYALTALAFYLAAWRRDDGARMMVAFSCISCAMLVHYSAGPVLLFMVGHYAWLFYSRRRFKWTEAGSAALASTAILATWIGWSLANYGWGSTFGSNTTAQGFQGQSFGASMAKIGTNIWYTLVPVPLRGAYGDDPTIATRVAARGIVLFRDQLFAPYQTELPTMFGLGCLGLVVWLTYSQLARTRDRPGSRRYRAFWGGFLAVVIPVGIAVHGSVDYLGVAHICLQPVVLVGLTLVGLHLATVAPWVRWAALAGLAVDAWLGVLLHVHLMKVSHFSEVHLPDGVGIAGVVFDPPYNASAVADWVRKSDAGLVFLGDRFAGISGGVETLAVLGLIGILVGMASVLARGPRVVAMAPATSRRGKAPVHRETRHRRRA